MTLQALHIYGNAQAKIAGRPAHLPGEAHMDVRDYRKTDHDIDPQFIERWSPRAFTGEDMPDETLFSCFEAARWAPSGGNAQPWRFVYAKKGTPEWQTFFDTAMEGTQAWLKNASVIVYFVSKTTATAPNGNVRPNLAHGFDCGAAWMSFALQVMKSGWVCHAAGSFKRDEARVAMGLPEGWDIHCVVGVSRQADKSTLPDALAEREVPNSRKPVTDLAMQGGFDPARG